MTLSRSNSRSAWLIRNFWLLTMLVNLVLVLVVLFVLILLLARGP